MSFPENHPPKVSVIIPTYNSVQHLPSAIDSVLAQTYHDYEIIVVDDGSTDDTMRVIAPYRNRVRYLQQENRGVGGARNAGIQMALGQYLVFLDADDLFLADKLTIQADYLDEHPDVDIVYSDGYLFRVNAQGKEEQRSFPAAGMLNKSLGNPGDSLRVLVIENAFPIHAAMVRTHRVIAIGGFDEQRNLMTVADWDLWYRLAAHCRFAYLDARVVKYRTAQTSMSTDRRHSQGALALLQSKIESSDAFGRLPNHIRSLAYFSWGVMDLEFGEPRMAISRFNRATECDPKNFYAASARFLTNVLGSRAVVFYHLKRRLVGTRRLPGLCG